MNAEDKIGIGALLVISAASFAFGMWIRRKEQAARTWPQVSGRIVTCELKRKPGPNGTEIVLPFIEYEFNHEGQIFKSSHWRFGNFSVGNSGTAHAVISRYAVGSPVIVFVNRQRPAKSVLEHQPSCLSGFLFGLGGFFLVLSVLVLMAVQ